MMPPLLSVIVTTKNRPVTAEHVVRTTLEIVPGDIELIVQDCSDTLELEQRLGTVVDERLRYEKTGAVSMTQNWNNAFARARGEYAIIIGDDDGVSSWVERAARWAAQEDFDVVTYRWSSFHWPDFPDAALAGRVVVPAATCKMEEVDVRRELERQSHSWGQDTSRLPQIYHGIVRRGLLERFRAVSGHYFASLSPDFYSGFAIGTQAARLMRLDYPLSMMGACGSSNTARGHRRASLGADEARRQVHPHLTEYASAALPSGLPDRINVPNVARAESMIQALRDAKRDDLLRNVDLGDVYAACVLAAPHDTLTLVRQLAAARREYHQSRSHVWGRLAYGVAGRIAVRGARRLRRASEVIPDATTGRAIDLRAALAFQDRVLERQSAGLPFAAITSPAGRISSEPGRARG